MKLKHCWVAVVAKIPEQPLAGRCVSIGQTSAMVLVGRLPNMRISTLSPADSNALRRREYNWPAPLAAYQSAILIQQRHGYSTLSVHLAVLAAKRFVQMLMARGVRMRVTGT